MIPELVVGPRDAVDPGEGVHSSKPDGQHIGIKGRLGGLDQLLAVIVAPALGFRLAPGEIDQSGLQRAMGLP